MYDHSRELTAAVLRRLVDYNPKTGAVVWRLRHRRYFDSDRACAAWNSKLAGKPAGTVSKNPKDKTAHLRCGILGTRYQLHRLIWLYHYGSWPVHGIDHDDGDGLNNRIQNLFDRPQGGEDSNMRNMPLTARNKSGRIGVSQHTRDRDFWVATIKIGDKVKYLGRSKNLDVAIALRAAAEIEQGGYNKNHGRSE